MSQTESGTTTEVVVRRGRAAAIVGAVVAIINIPLLLVAASDKSWGAFWIAVMYGPIANGVLALISITCTPWMRRATGVPATYHALMSLLIPTAAAIADFYLIFSMNLHGC